jgi:hypothetical protein
VLRNSDLRGRPGEPAEITGGDEELAKEIADQSPVVLGRGDLRGRFAGERTEIMGGDKESIEQRQSPVSSGANGERSEQCKCI